MHAGSDSQNDCACGEEIIYIVNKNKKANLLQMKKTQQDNCTDSLSYYFNRYLTLNQSLLKFKKQFCNSTNNERSNNER